MTDPLRGRATAFLLRIGLFAGLLSIVAGIVGMHVMTGGHSMHATPVVSASAVASPSAVGSPAHAVHTVAERASPPDKAAVCVPAPSHNTLAAPWPGVPPYANAGTAEAGALISGYSHRPGSPSPGDLCISRT